MNFKNNCMHRIIIFKFEKLLTTKNFNYEKKITICRIIGTAI